MQGDFSRNTFDAARHFSRVLMQQGRVHVDADWNEQTSILLHYLRTLAQDLMGPHAGPVDAAGFGIITDPAEINDEVEADEERRKYFVGRVTDGDLLIGKGRYYVRGVLVENDANLLYSEQAGYPFNEESKLEHLKGTMSLAYLDVWERHITCVEDERIREVALEGVDTCTRAQVVWQVKILPRPAGIKEADFDCDKLETLLARTLPTLRARARQPKSPSGLCVVSAESNYRGVENQLYRVEVHRGGKADDPQAPATFKWSRENGSVTFPILTLSDAGASLADLGRDQCLSLKPGDWVEVMDDRLALSGRPGPLAQVETVDRDKFRVTLTWARPPGPTYVEKDQATHPLLRRWDQQGDLAQEGALAIKERANDPAGLGAGWIDLEDGIQIWFGKEGAEYRTGDAWNLVARVVAGDIDWPVELGADAKPVAARKQPQGPLHYYAPLCLLGLGGPNPSRDCRCLITPPACP